MSEVTRKMVPNAQFQDLGKRSISTRQFVAAVDLIYEPWYHIHIHPSPTNPLSYHTRGDYEYIEGIYKTQIDTTCMPDDKIMTVVGKK